MTNEQVAFGGADIIWAAAIIDYSLPPSPDISAPMHQIYIFLDQTLCCTFRVLTVICTRFISSYNKLCAVLFEYLRSYAPYLYPLITNSVHYSSHPVLYCSSTYDHPARLHQTSRHIQSPMMFPCTQTGSGPWVSFYKVHVGLKGRRESQWLNECCHSGIALNFDELRTVFLIDRVHQLDC